MSTDSTEMLEMNWDLEWWEEEDLHDSEAEREMLGALSEESMEDMMLHGIDDY